MFAACATQNGKLPVIFIADTALEVDKRRIEWINTQNPPESSWTVWPTVRVARSSKAESPYSKLSDADKKTVWNQVMEDCRDSIKSLTDRACDELGPLEVLQYLDPNTTLSSSLLKLCANGTQFEVLEDIMTEAAIEHLSWLTDRGLINHGRVSLLGNEYLSFI